VYAFWLLSELVIGESSRARVARHPDQIRRPQFPPTDITEHVPIPYDRLSFCRFWYRIVTERAFYLGIGLMIAGILLRQWSIAVPGRYFSRTFGVQEARRWWTAAVSSGASSRYTGSLLTMVGLGFVLQSWGRYSCS